MCRAEINQNRVGEEDLTHLVLDLLVLMVLGFCVWQGYRKGLILTVAGLLILVIAVWGGAKVADRFADSVVEKVNPILNWVSDEATEQAIREHGRDGNTKNEKTIKEIAVDAFASLGVVDQETDTLAERVITTMKTTGLSLRESIANTFIRTVCWVILFIFGFAIVTLLLTLLAHFISMLFNLPGLKLVDTVGGMVSGLIYGLIILFAIGWIMRFLGILIPKDLVDGTFFLRFFVYSNPLTSVLS